MKFLRRIVCARKGHDWRWCYNDWTVPGQLTINESCARRCGVLRQRTKTFTIGGPIKVKLVTNRKGDAPDTFRSSAEQDAVIEETHRTYTAGGARFRWPGLWR